MTVSRSELFEWTTFTPPGIVSGGWKTLLAAAVDMHLRSGIMMVSGISRRTVSDVGTSRFIKSGILLTIAIVLAVSAAQLINYGFFDQRISVLDSESDGGVFGVLGDIALATAAASASVLAVRVRSARLVAAALAGLLTFLAADKVTRLHDHIPHWLAFYLPVLFASFICLAAVGRGPSGHPKFRVDRRAGRAVMDRLIRVGLLLLAFSFLLHVFGERLLLGLGVSDTTGLTYQIKVVVKHGTEVAGWLMIALGLLRLGLPRRAHPDAVETQLLRFSS
jgi:hypothetical protein